MTNKTPSILLTIVVSVLGTSVVWAQNSNLTQSLLTPPVGGTRGKEEVELLKETLKRQGDKEDKDRQDRINKDCLDKRAESKKTLASVMSFCKGTKVKGNASSAERSKAANECSDTLRSCREISSSELPFSMPGVDSSYLSSIGMNPQNFMADDGDGEKRCSLLSYDKHESLVEKLQNRVKDAKKEYKDLNDKIDKDKASDQEKLERAQKEFAEAQEAKDKSDAEAAEQALNKQSAYAAKKREFESKLRQINTEISQAQKNAEMLTSQRSLEVSIYKQEIRACKKALTDYYKTRTPGVLAHSQAAATANDPKKEYYECKDKALAGRLIRAKDYELKLQAFNEIIQNKIADLNAEKKAASELDQMYAQSQESEANQKQKKDQSFLGKQQQSYLSMQNMINRSNEIAQKTQSFLMDAQQSVTQASNKLNRYEGEEPVGNKSLEEAQAEVSKYLAASGLEEQTCRDSTVPDTSSSSEGAK